jgi:hypothetical protein
MNQAEFDKLAKETVESMYQLLVVKGGEYAGSEDRLGNFKRGAALAGVTPLQVAFVYAAKHYDSIATFVRDQASGTSRPRSESMAGRFDDLANYCLLMKALVVEEENGRRKIEEGQVVWKGHGLPDPPWVEKEVSTFEHLTKGMEKGAWK